MLTKYSLKMWILTYVFLVVYTQTAAGQNDCHCLDKSGCPDTCNSLCESGFSGPSCHSTNIAMGLTPRFSPGTEVVSGTPEQTVDGNTADANCVSVRGTNHRWEIRFAEVRTITKLRIFWSDADFPQGVLAIIVDINTCQTSATPPTGREITYTCSSPMRGDVVWFQNQISSGTMTVCEVEIYECVDGFYGADCASRCNCNGIKNCDKTNGLCPQQNTTAVSTSPSTTSSSASTSAVTTPYTTTATSTTAITSTTTTSPTSSDPPSTSETATTTATSPPDPPSTSKTATTTTPSPTTSGATSSPPSSTPKLPDTTPTITPAGTSTVKATGNENECVDGFYGADCTPRCNCNGIKNCDKINGLCPQQTNIAGSGSVEVFDVIESRFPASIQGDPSVTTDGDTSLTSCFIINGTQPSWKATFDKQYVVYGLTLYVPNSAQLAKLSVVVGGIICYQRSSPVPITTPYRFKCFEQLTGDYVTVYIPQSDSTMSLALCEVEVYGKSTNTEREGIPIAAIVVPCVFAVAIFFVVAVVIVFRRKGRFCVKSKNDSGEPHYAGLERRTDDNYTTLTPPPDRNEPGPYEQMQLEGRHTYANSAGDKE